MKPSIEKLQKFFKLEAERGYDNHAVMGGLENMLNHWEAEAHADGLPDELIQAIVTRIKDYSRLSETSRAEALEGILRRIQRAENNQVSEAEIETGISDSIEDRGISAAPTELEKLIEEQSLPKEASESQIQERLPQPEQTLTPEPLEVVEPVELETPITELKGIGPRHEKSLNRLGLYNLGDMLYHFPWRYDDYSQLRPINRLMYGDVVTVIGTVDSMTVRTIKSGKSKIVEGVVSDGSASLRVTWFNQEWIAKRLRKGTHIALSGKIDQYLGRLVINNPEWEPLEQQQLNTNRIVPVYPLTTQITQRWLRRQMDALANQWAPRVIDPLPVSLRQSANLVSLPTALNQIHFPDSWDDLSHAQERLAFDEIFLLQLGVLRQKHTWIEGGARAFHAEENWLNGQIARLPFSLTAAQQKALNDITHDLASGRPMNRLLQGDVGSGKTVIAALGIAIVVHKGAQAAIMAPTSILAEQHYNNMFKILSDPVVLPGVGLDYANMAPALRRSEIRLLIGATPETEKRQILAGLASGSIKLVIGTHALIEDPVEFANLQMVVVDEQHRFGVDQRASLRSKGANPHLLVMTATPIPRSLALTIYGDLDLSVVDEMPPGRIPVNTYVLYPRERERAYELIRSQVQKGQQAFIIYPLVEEGDNSDTKAAVNEYSLLQEEIFPDLAVGLLHGRMKPEEKEIVMRQFRDGAYQILVSTSVIEVGVDVPNAAVMLVEGANRFGLAQLHQFRGRVGRGSDQSYCLLIPESPDDIENERLQVMEKTNDGFVLAEYDLEQRGPGQFLGTRQSGYSELKLANLTDVRLIEKARRYALSLFEDDPNLTKPEHQPLVSYLDQAWGGKKGDIS